MRFSQDYKPDTHWLDPMNRVIFQNAVKAQNPTATLRDGRVFNLTYLPKSNTVLIKPQYGRVPFGTFSTSKILDPNWIEEKES